MYHSYIYLLVLSFIYKFFFFKLERGPTGSPTTYWWLIGLAFYRMQCLYVQRGMKPYLLFELEIRKQEAGGQK